MSDRIGRRREQRMLGEVMHGEDLASIAARYRMSPRALAEWVCRPEVARQLVTQVRAADLQVESCVSRYRMVAATRLLELASARESQKGDETIRRACKDVLTPRVMTVEKKGDGGDVVSPSEIIRRIDAAMREAEAREA